MNLISLHKPFKNHFLWLVAEEVREIDCMRTWRGPYDKECWKFLEGAQQRNGSSVLQPQGTELRQQPEQAWKLVFPHSFQTSSQPGCHLDFCLVNP